MIKRALLLLALAGSASAQTTGGFVQGQTLTAAQLNGAFAKKADYPITITGYPTLLGRNVFYGYNTFSGSSPLNLAPITSSVTSNPGDLWFTNSGAFANVNGTVYQIVGAGARVDSFNSRTGAVTLASGDVTGALGYTPANSASVVSSFNSRTGAVTLSSGDVTGAVGTGGAAQSNLGFGSAALYNVATGGVNLPRLDLANTWSSKQSFGGGLNLGGISSSVGNDVWSDGSHMYVNLGGTAYQLDQQVASSGAVQSFNGRGGTVTFLSSDITGVGGCLTSTCVSSFNSRTGAVALSSGDVTGALGYIPASSASVVSSFNSRTGAVSLSSGDVTGALGYTPADSASVVSSFNSRTGDVTLSSGDVTGVGGCLSSTCVSSFNSRTGAVSLSSGDVTGAVGTGGTAQSNLGFGNAVLYNTGTSGANLSRLDTGNTWANYQVFSSGINVSNIGSPANGDLWSSGTHYYGRLGGSNFQIDGQGGVISGVASDHSSGTITYANGITHQWGRYHIGDVASGGTTVVVPFNTAFSSYINGAPQFIISDNNNTTGGSTSCQLNSWYGSSTLSNFTVSCREFSSGGQDLYLYWTADGN